MASESQTMPNQDKDKKHVNLLLVGKTGTGLSSTCKTIVDAITYRKSGAEDNPDARSYSSNIKSAGGWNSITEGMEVATGKLDRETNVTVVVASSLYNLKHERSEDVFEDSVKKSFDFLTQSHTFDAVVFVMSYRSRLGEEEIRAFKTVRRVIGPKIAEVGVIVMTGGDSFSIDEDIAVEEFAQWFRNQASFRDISAEFRGRVVLFDNATDSKAKKNTQIELFVEELKKINRCYSFEDYMHAKDRARYEFVEPPEQRPSRGYSQFSMKEELKQQVQLLLEDIIQIPDQRMEDDRKRVQKIYDKVRNLRLDLDDIKRNHKSGWFS